MSTHSDINANPPGYSFGQRFRLAGRIRSLPLLRLAALWESFFVAAASLRQNKLRTALTLVGIIVGVTAVIAVVTIIKGLDQTVAQTFSSQGSTVFTISKRPRVITSREDFIKYNKRKDITEDDAEAIFRLCTNCWRTGIVANRERRRVRARSHGHRVGHSHKSLSQSIGRSGAGPGRLGGWPSLPDRRCAPAVGKNFRLRPR